MTTTATARPPARSRRSRFPIFLTVALSIWGAVHAYVGARVLDVASGVGAAWALVGLVALGMSFPALKIAERAFGLTPPAWLEHVASTWLGIVLQLFVWFVLADAVIVLAGTQPTATRTVALVLAAALSVVGIVQGTRRPRVVRRSVSVQSLPPELDGSTIVHLTDLHLGGAVGERWLRSVVERVNELEPDLIALTGDIIDGNPTELRSLIPTLSTMRARLGAWAVSGNHEYYVGLEDSLTLLEDAGCRVLRDAWAEAAPGLLVAGVDDLTARRQLGDHDSGAAVEATLAGHPDGAATVFLCHSPLAVEEAARAGVDVMLCGHTHGGQVWPMGGLVRLAYRHVAGRFQVGGMTLIVSRGTGNWGPRMRLFRRAEICCVELRRDGRAERD